MGFLPGLDCIAKSEACSVLNHNLRHLCLNLSTLMTLVGTTNVGWGVKQEGESK